MRLIFKICDQDEWNTAQVAGIYHGSAHDQQDGFIHFSTSSQLPGTLAKHYAGRDQLLLIAFDADAMGEALKWEPARHGDLFPHLYVPLSTSAVLWAELLLLGENGVHILPAGAAP